MIRQFDIVIVGGGIAGLSMAAALAHSFADASQRLPAIALVDAAAAPAQWAGASPAAESVDSYDPRASAITEANCQRFEKWGIWQGLEPLRFGDFDKMFVWDGEGTASIAFDAAAIDAPKLGAVIENSQLVTALYQHLQRHGAVQFFNQQQLEQLELADAEAGTLRLQLGDDVSLEAALVIGADGARSKVRSLSGYQVRRWDYQHDAIVCSVQTEKPLQRTAWQCFTRHGPLALLPLGEAGPAPSGCLSSIVWSQQRGRAEALMALDDEAFRAELASAFEGRHGAIVANSKRFSFPLTQQHATRYLSSAHGGSAGALNVALIGDAAHTIHPLAGQGINLGIQDALCLADAIVSAYQRTAGPVDTAALRRFERERLTENLAMMSVVEGFKRLFSPGFSALQLLRNRGMAVLESQPALKRRIAKLASGL